ncbi:alpha/beta hydrolase [Ammoniphilus resinae]|uniref:Esterase/lipase n=1 Tax=Ammoniphilus resinae TaxID=861532 RepID=A0ABS4GTK1_9BACL|nr:alpha/beta fold hydrolase [Ammoniphilus resinae]MBP1933603.1 esterase/lipase [Ammoniphilus resinae]
MNRFIPGKVGLNIHVKENLFPGRELFILCHGFTGSIQSHVISATRNVLTEQQLSNVSVDFTNNLNEADGQFVNHTLSGEVADLEVIFHSYRDAYESIYLVGHSMGCTVALQFSLDFSPSGLLLIAPPYSMKDIILEIAKATYGDSKTGLEKWKREQTIPIYKEKDKAYYPLSYEFYRDLEQIEPHRYVGISSPAAVIYSATDPVVPPRQSVQLFETIGSVRKKLLLVDDAPHSFDTPPATAKLLKNVQQGIQFLRK